MPARLLAYGGTGFIERRRIGQWPSVPEATLRDTYGLSANSWSYGLGIISKQPFLIFRQRQNIENRGGYPFTVLLDPGDAVWERFECNGAAIITALLEANPDVLFRSPETCSSDALERLTAALNMLPQTGAASDLCDPIVASTTASEPLVLSQTRPEAPALAATLSLLPICFRTARGWLMGGGSAHGRVFGANLVIDEQSLPGGDSPQQTGRTLMQAWTAARQRSLVQPFEVKPMWTWDQAPHEVLNSVLLLREIETAQAPNDGLIDRMQQATVFRDEIEEAAIALLTRGSAPIEPKGSLLLIRLALQDKRKLDGSISNRLDERTLRSELKKLGCPPKRIPKTIAISPALHTKLWVEYLETLQSDVRKNLADGLDQLGAEARGQLVESALYALPSSEENLIEWARFRKDPETWPLLTEPLRKETLRRFQRNVKGAADAYLALADDPGGALASKDLPLDTDAARLVHEIRDLDTPEAHAWLNALKKSPLQQRLPKPVPRQRRSIVVPPAEPSQAKAESSLEQELRALLFESDQNSLEARAAKLSGINANGPLEALDKMIFEQSEIRGAQFAAAFRGNYTALGDAFRLLSDAAQDRLLECLGEDYLKEHTAAHVGYALRNKTSRNAYTRALTRRVMQDRQLKTQVAKQMVELPSDLEIKLKAMLKDGRG
jgi:hypothetical protein